MAVQRSFAFSSSQSIAFCNLTNVYNTRVHEQYRKDLLVDNRKVFGIFLPIEGNTHLLLRNGKRITVQRNSIAFVMIGDLATVLSDDDGRHCINYWFMAHGINVPVNKIFRINDVDTKKEIDFANDVIELLRTQIDYKAQYANIKFTCRLLEWLEEVQKLNTPKNKDLEVVDDAIIYINDNLTKGLNVKVLAQKFGYCEKHFRNIFKATTGITPKQYINNVRLDNAATLLVTTDMTLQEIADELCFATISHFINCFKTKYGASPTEYRNITSNYLYHEQPNPSPPPRKKVKVKR